MSANDIMYTSPLIALVICGAFLVVEVFRCNIDIVNSILQFIVAMVAGAILGFGVSVLVVMVLTMNYSSSQGPLALIYYGPIGIAVGEFLGAIFWRLRVMKSNKSPQPTADGGG